jgi:hypothetical protein
LGLRGTKASEQQQQQQSFHSGLPEGLLFRFNYNYGTPRRPDGEVRDAANLSPPPAHLLS